MSVIRDKFITSIDGILKQAQAFVQDASSEKDPASTLHKMSEVVNNVHRLAIQARLKYTFEYASLSVQIIEMIRNSAGELNSDDRELILFLSTMLIVIFRRESSENINIIIYENIHKATNQKLKAYSSSTAPIEHLVRNEYSLLSSILPTNSKKSLQDMYQYFTAHKSKIQFHIHSPKVQIAENILNKLYCVLSEFKELISRNTQAGEVNVSLHNYIVNGKLMIDFICQEHFIDFDFFGTRGQELGLLQESQRQDTALIFQYLFSSEYFDNEDKSSAFKKIGLTLEFLNASIRFIPQGNIIQLAVPCNFVVQAFDVRIGEGRFFVPSVYIQEAVECANLEQVKDRLRNENINPCFVEDVLTGKSPPPQYLLFVNVLGNKFAYSCDEFLGQKEIQVYSLSKNRFAHKVVANVVGVEANEGVLVLDMVYIASKAHKK